jgi:hypothetical protein
VIAESVGRYPTMAMLQALAGGTYDLHLGGELGADQPSTARPWRLADDRRRRVADWHPRVPASDRLVTRAVISRVRFGKCCSPLPGDPISGRMPYRDLDHSRISSITYSAHRQETSRSGR